MWGSAQNVDYDWLAEECGSAPIIVPCQSLAYSPTLTHSLALILHWSRHSLTHSPAHLHYTHLSLNHTFSQLLNHLLIQSYIHSIARSLGRSFVQSLNHPIMTLVTGKILVCSSITVSGNNPGDCQRSSTQAHPVTFIAFRSDLYCFSAYAHCSSIKPPTCHHPQFALICKSPNCLRWH